MALKDLLKIQEEHNVIEEITEEMILKHLDKFRDLISY